ncbi:hypothetical protein [Alteribacillus sp. YIM 98480]|uniref:hypothetical protein n=1 Tax=Alteribacillus sp. YIM 98480 TaxID=2606599 RepID=UPI00131B0D90|nr:hypothetical protein [Alteribacillus sp. YIM 98480]
MSFYCTKCELTILWDELSDWECDCAAECWKPVGEKSIHKKPMNLYEMKNEKEKCYVIADCEQRARVLAYEKLNDRRMGIRCLFEDLCNESVSDVFNIT